ncbi:MAG: amidohydrolase [Myxococcales bacterium]
MSELLVVGTLYTMDPSRPRARAALVRDGRFAAVGSREECERLAARDVRLVDVGPGCAVPGLADAHGHVALYGRTRSEVDCAGAASEAECAARAAKAAAKAPPGTWVRGGGWSHDLWREQRLPSAASLSAAVPDHPVALARSDVHALWVNDAALRAAGIDARTRDPDGGRIERSADGAPTGILVDNAMRFVFRAMPRARAEDIEANLLRGLEAAAQAGLTSVHDAGLSPEVLEVYRKLAAEDRLPVRVYGMLDGQQPLATLDAQMDLWKRTPAVGFLTVRSVKLFADGALGSRGAKLFDPYSDDPKTTGLWVTPPEELRARIARVAAAGYQPCVHAIGDHACAETLDAFCAAPSARALRPRAEHLQLLRPEDAALLRASGAIASMQPTHATSDAPWAEARIGRGTPRQKGAYAWRQALEAGAVLAFGSDFPVESLDPRRGLASAVLRRPEGASAAWMPEQTVTLEEALRAFTWGAAWAEHAESRRGAIKPGYDADLTLFGRDLFSLSPEDLADAPLLGTVVSGRLFHQGS